MKLSEKIKELDFKGRDFPIIAGTVKFKLHNVHNGKDEVVEEHNMATNALKDIFTNNCGGLINYQNFADLYNTWLGGVLLFQNQLDLTSADDYGIPAYTSNPVKAHAGQTILSDQSDDLTRGNPDNTGTVLAVDSTKLCWEWGTSAGNGTIASLGLTHSDVGSYGCGVVSTAQQSLNPFASVGSVSRQYAYDDNGNCPLAIDGNLAYSVYMSGGNTVNIYITPINNTKFKLQGGALLPTVAYSTKITVTLTAQYATSRQGYYYWFDFDNNKLVLFGVSRDNGSVLYRDDINLQTKEVTHSSITVTGANLWAFDVNSNKVYDTRPTKAMVYNNHLYVYGYTSTYTNPNKLYIINLAETTDISEVDMTDFPNYQYAWRVDSFDAFQRTNEQFTTLGGIIVHRSFLINGDKLFVVSDGAVQASSSDTLALGGISSPDISPTYTKNVISVCKLYLATKFNLPNAVTKTSAQSMRVEYSLQEV